MNHSLRSLFAIGSRVAALAATVASLTISGHVSAQALVDIANTPLYGGTQAHPNVVVTTSVEFPTVGAAYLVVGGVANPYASGSTYIGYFDASKCYAYSNTAQAALYGGGYFYPTVVRNPECAASDGFSGNYMNWLTMSAIDEFRFAMTGGNRVVENGPNFGTIIQRAVLPDGSNGTPSFFGDASGYFPRQSIRAGSTVLPNEIGVGNGTIQIASCGYKVYFGVGTSSDCNNPGNAGTYGVYNVRVLVCDATEGPVRTDLCQQYGGLTGHYKPTGVVQANASRMRFAAFGYLLDYNAPGGYASGCSQSGGWNKCRYGGVLRAPMKYLGPTQYDANLVPSINLNAEILPDGTLATDPDGSALITGGYSGFINYINRFGSGGVYKTYDPMGEMYYEAIRYYQHLGPTPDATSTYTGAPLTNAVLDNFPIYTNWADPIKSTCSANYIINLSDSNTWDDSYLPGYAGNPSPQSRPGSRAVVGGLNGGLDSFLWTQRIGTLESTTSSLTANDVRPGLAGIETRRTSAEAVYLAAGAAYYVNANDIRTDLIGTQTIKTFSFDVDETGSIDFHDRQLYLMAKYGGFTNNTDRTTDTFANPFYSANTAAGGAAIRTNVEWESSPGSGVPANYVRASNPLLLVSGLRNAFARINSGIGTLSGASLTSANLNYGPADAYIATFNPSKWSGSVIDKALSVDGTGNLVVATNARWNSADSLDLRCGTVSTAATTCTDTDTSSARRSIFTTVSSGLLNPVRTAVPFTYADISTRDVNYTLALNANPLTGLPDGLGQQRLNYLRGYRGDEVSLLSFRPRDSAMGDIINSGPVYVGYPSSAIPDADYQSFYQQYAITTPRTPAVYVGANDGMLHALRASDGYELFSYIPGFSSKDLNDLTNPGYAHQTYVDTVPKIQEVKIGSTWKTVLVGANGNGVQGIFGLDVSDPSSFGTSNVLFEFSDADDADFGSVLAAPEIAKLWVSGSAAAPVYRYFAVVTGYNNKQTTVNNRPDTQVSSDTMNRGVLFLIALDHVLGTTWVNNVDYYKFTFPASVVANSNGLGPVTLLASRSGDRSTASMYFGDLQGNLWKFNTATGNPSTWAPALGTRASPLPIFVARDAGSNRQPITARVELASGPYGGTLVYFGTGRYLGSTDLTLPGATQSEYALLDLNPSVLISRTSDLVARTGTNVACAAPNASQNCTVNVTGAAFSFSGPSAKKGWYLDFPSSASLGERSITKPAVRTGLLTFTTLTLSSDLCSAGNGYVYQVNALTGLPVDGVTNTIGYASTVGIPGPPRIVDLVLTQAQSQVTGEQINSKTSTTVVSGTSGNIGSYSGVGTNPDGTSTGAPPSHKVPPTLQINWREISNWNDQKGN